MIPVNLPARYCVQGSVFMTIADGAEGQLCIATCPVNWNNNDLGSWRPITPYPTILDRMREAGYRATEYDGLFGADVANVQNEMRARDMVLTGSYQWVDFLAKGDDADAYDDLKPTLELLVAVGCHNLIVSDSLRSHRVALAGRVPADGSESLDADACLRIANGIHTLAAIASGYGIRIRYHNHVGSWIEAPHEVDALLRHLDTSLADLCFDTGHYAYGGGNPYQFIRDNLGKIGYMHLKDVDSRVVAEARARNLSFLDALCEIVFSPIGTGSADIPAILSFLVEHRFDGWVVVEQDTCAGDPTDTAQMNLAFIEQWLDVHHIIGR